MKNKFLLMLTLVASIICFGISPSYADGITIGNGAALVLNDASMNLGCSDIIVESGGTLDVGSGTITKIRQLSIVSGGIYIPGTGLVYYCGAFLPGTFELLLIN